MYKYLLTLIFFIAVAFISIALKKSQDKYEAQKIKEHYLQLTTNFITAIVKLQTAAEKGNEKEMQQLFFETRKAYKKTEPFVTYFFDFYAGKLNGPPLPYFEEAEADMPVNIPGGMQVIENFLFPEVNKTTVSDLKIALNELLRYAQELPTVQESFEFSDAFIFDALIEEMYRITALGITGFDSQTALHSLPECAAALQGLQEYLAIYKDAFNKSMPGSYNTLAALLQQAQSFLQGANFNTFNRMHFITRYLNPATQIMGAYKKTNQLADNAAGLYYSSLKKNNSLFAADAFNPYRFIDDYKTSPEKITLGKMLFFDSALSANNRRSCASCHQPDKAFTDGLTTSTALDGHTALPRNAPTIWNAALQRNLFADSRSRTLEDQVMQVLNNAREMHGTAQTAAEKILLQKKYTLVYESAYPDAPVTDAAVNICNAIACYERTLISLNSSFDKHMKGQYQLSNNEINGFNLFMGKAKCGTCHFMPLFNGAKPPRYYYTESEVIGVPAAGLKKATLDGDSGRYKHTGFSIHLYAFKTPTVRNASVTAPYMHNGVFTTLKEVVAFYNKGGGKGLGIAPHNQSLPFERLGLTAQERKNIILFIKCLTDTSGIYK